MSLDHGVSVSGQKYESHSHSVHFPDFRLRKSVQQLAPKMRNCNEPRWLGGGFKAGIQQQIAQVKAQICLAQLSSH